MQRTPPTRASHVSTYLKTAPSTTPLETMDARQQAHINELTEQLRSAEHISKKLREELAQAQVQMKAERASLHEQRLKEAQAWKVGIELTKASFRVTQARLLLLLDMEKRNALSKEDAARSERFARVQRDCDLIPVQQKVDDLEEKAIELQEMLEVERQRREKDDQEYEELRQRFADALGKYGKLKGKYSALLAKSAEMRRDLEQSGAKLSEMEDDVSRLEEEVKSLKAESATANAELKRCNADLKRQVDKVRSLENKEGTETESLKNEAVALEAKLRELESRLSERERDLTEDLKLKDAKIERFRSRLHDYVGADKESREFIAQLEQTCEKLNRTVAALRDENVKLKAELSTAEQEIEIRNTVEREHRVSLHPVREEPHPLPTPKPKPTRKTKADVGEGPSKPPPSKKKPPPPEPETESEEVEEAPKPKPRPKPVKKQPSRHVSELAEDDSKPRRGKKPSEEDVEKPRPRPKPKKKPPVQETAEDSDVDIEIEELEPEPSKPKRKGKVKATVPQESISNAPNKRGRPKTSTEEEDRPPKKKSATKKVVARPSATSQRRDEEDEAEEEARVKKKRKLKIFNSSQPSTFTWNFPADKATNGLDIPTELSPMKEGEPTIPRSIFSSRTSSSFIK